MGRHRNTQKQQRKAKIHARMKNADGSDLIVIPAKPIQSIEEDKSIHRVAAYCRVSTDEDAQTLSFDLQKSTYTEMITTHPGWELAGIYADEGISGTSFNHRDGMKQMIEDCKAGKIDMIITKSIARFARNIVDCLSTVEMLKNLPHPVGVQFETEHLYTLDDSGRMILAILSTVAEEESHSKSSIMNWSIENRFSKGLFLTPPLYGYDQDPETKELVVNPEEAKIVQLCFGLFLSDWSLESIADTLTGLGVPTFTGKEKWHPTTILRILQNERHYGAVLAHKTFTPSFLNHKAKKNTGERKQYLREDDHEPIVSKKIFEAANRKIMMDKAYHHGSPMPSLDIVDDGILKGFVSVNRKWEGFTDQDFLEATESVMDEAKVPEKETQQKDTFCIDDYQVVSSKFFSHPDRTIMTIKDGAVRFNTACMRKFGEVEDVEILMNPVEKKIAVRPCSEDSPYAFRWGKYQDSKWRVSTRKCKGLIEPLVSLMDWNPENTYRLVGEYYQNGESQMLVFDLSMPEVIEPENTDTEALEAQDLIEEDNVITFGEPACFGTVVFESEPYAGDWEIMRPARFYRYCTDITEEELMQIRKETSELLAELKGA